MTLWALCKEEFSSPLFPPNMLILSVQRNGSIFHSASRQKESIKLHEFLESKYSRCSLINKHLSISFATTIHSPQKLERYWNFLLTKKILSFTLFLLPDRISRESCSTIINILRFSQVNTVLENFNYTIHDDEASKLLANPLTTRCFFLSFYFTADFCSKGKEDPLSVRRLVILPSSCPISPLCGLRGQFRGNSTRVPPSPRQKNRDVPKQTPRLFPVPRCSAFFARGWISEIGAQGGPFRVPFGGGGQ